MHQKGARDTEQLQQKKGKDSQVNDACRRGTDSERGSHQSTSKCAGTEDALQKADQLYSYKISISNVGLVIIMACYLENCSEL